GVGAHDGGVEFELTLGDVAIGALLIVDLGQVDVILAGGEVDVVMAGSASGAAGVGVPGFGLGSAGGLLVAGFALENAGEGAAAAVCGELDVGPVGNGVVE